MFRDDNNRLVPMVLDRINMFYTMLCDEIEFANSSTKPLSDPNLSNDKPKIDSTSMLCDNSKQKCNFHTKNKYNEVYKHKHFLSF